MGKLERDFQPTVIKELYQMFPDCIIIKTDPSYIQGFPDLLVLYHSKWAALECKKDRYAPHQPNQDQYIRILDQLSYAAFIYPENKEEIFDELQYAFEIA